MPSPGEHKTVQARILAYAQEIGWTFVPREEAERRFSAWKRKRTRALQVDKVIADIRKGLRR
jgi:hypothetical protein